MTGLILAAGRSKRMGQPVPKVLMLLKDRPVLAYVLDTCRAAGTNRILVVVGNRKEQVQQAFAGERVEFVVQQEPRGTADAVLSCAGAVQPGEDVLVLSGDVPLVRVERARASDSSHASGTATELSTTVRPPRCQDRIARPARLMRCT